MSRLRWAVPACLIGALGVVIGSVAVAVANIPAADGTITGCYGKKAGNLRVIDAATSQCDSNENKLTWNQTGPQGPAGPPGPAGPQGPPGPASVTDVHVHYVEKSYDLDRPYPGFYLNAQCDIDQVLNRPFTLIGGGYDQVTGPARVIGSAPLAPSPDPRHFPIEWQVTLAVDAPGTIHLRIGLICARMESLPS
jgi:hypothetical protein